MSSQQDVVACFVPSLQPVPDSFRTPFAPATHIAYEWCEYLIEYPGADRLQVGSTAARHLRGGLFQLTFKNQLGLTTIRPYAGAAPLAPPLHVEVISQKFPQPGAHLTFLRTLVDDLFTRAARLPFTFTAQTSRGVEEALKPPSPLFTLHFLCQHGATLRQALATVLAAPHRVLADHPEQVPLAAVSEVDPDVLLSIIQSPKELVPARGRAVIAYQGRKYAPGRVWQRMPEESFDTPENRFVRAFVRTVLTAAEVLQSQAWWPKVPSTRQTLIREVAATLRQALAHPVFDHVGELSALPVASQVLMRREGYRDIRELWQLFQRARRPLFEPMRHAIELRDVAELYEVWCFFTLAEEIAAITNQPLVLDLRLDDERGLGWNATAHFGQGRKLIYNAWGRSYSKPLRPDFTWHNGGDLVVLDAKFRMERRAVEDDGTTAGPASEKDEDIYKMHTYRDALSARAAVIVYPGDLAIFYHTSRLKQTGISLAEVLFGNLTGVGAIPLRPTISLLEPS